MPTALLIVHGLVAVALLGACKSAPPPVKATLLDDSLAELESRLGERFLRVHRNALVARAAVRALERRAMEGVGDDEGGEGWAVRVAPVDEWLAVSRRQLAAVREALVAAGR